VGVTGIFLGSAGGFGCALIWFRIFAEVRPAADPVDNWARAVTQLVAAIAAAAVGAVIGGIAAAIFVNRSPPDRPKE
jgi:anaerobic C4-dicarboxylate transporter